MGLFDWLKKNETTENLNENDLDENLAYQQENDFEENGTGINQAETSDGAAVPDYITQKELSVKETDETMTEENNTDESGIFLEADNVGLCGNSDDIQPVFVDNEKYIDDEQPKKKTGFFRKIKDGLAKTRNNILSGVEEVLGSFSQIDDDLFEELEEALIMADIGVETSAAIIEKLRDRVKNDKIKDASLVKPLLIEVINSMMKSTDDDFVITPPTVIMVIGVNGVGKTTTIGKLANNIKGQGKSVMLAAADTFRAAAIDQLEVWGERNDVPVIKHQEKSDPGAVVFDAVKSAKAKGIDVLICDTAGRLHNKKNLMDELHKITKIIEREYSEAALETFLVLDATTGQNAVQQAKLFNEVADITGIVLTKLDGTAKGGIVLAIKNEMNIPVRYIGVGEGIDDLQPFNSMEFSRALFDEE